MSRRGIQEEIPAPLNTALEGQTDSTQVSKQPGCWKVPKHGGERLKEGSILDRKCRGDHVQEEGKGRPS